MIVLINRMFNGLKCLKDDNLMLNIFYTSTFSADHCLERHYSFQIRRCNDINCCSQTEKVSEWLPDPVEDASGNHYKKFEDLLGHVTNEKDRPSSRGRTTAAVAQELQVSYCIASEMKYFDCIECSSLILKH